MIDYMKVVAGQLIAAAANSEGTFKPWISEGDVFEVLSKEIEYDEGNWPMITAKHQLSGRTVTLAPVWFNKVKGLNAT